MNNLSFEEIIILRYYKRWARDNRLWCPNQAKEELAKEKAQRFIWKNLGTMKLRYLIFLYNMMIYPDYKLRISKSYDSLKDSSINFLDSENKLLGWISTERK